MIRPIVLYGHKSLRQASVACLPGEELSDLIADLMDTVVHAKGLGLAAPQIGVNLQVFVVSGKEIDNKDLPGDYLEAFINPQLEMLGQEQNVYEEGCLSIPDIRADVQRPRRIKLHYENPQREPQSCVADGLLARIIQHEYDHLLGKLFIDHLPLLKRQMLKRKLSAISKKAVG